MSYKKTHQMAGRNGARHSRGTPSRTSPAPPRSTLASLLSSQRRSAVQSDRYRVQQARPFADRTLIDQAVAKGGVKYSKSPREKGRGNNILHQASMKASNTNTSAGSSSSSDFRSNAPDVREAKAETPSRRVRFSSSSDPIPIKSEEIPRRKSRWDMRASPSAPVQSKSCRKEESLLGMSGQQQEQNRCAVENERTKNNTTFPTNKAIPRKKGRSEKKAYDIHQRFIQKNSTSSSTTENRSDEQSLISRPSNALHRIDSTIGTSPTSRANSFSHCSSRWGENNSQTISLKNSAADAALDTSIGLNEVGDNTHMPSMKDGRMPKDVTFEAKEFGKNMQSKCDTLKSPKSEIKRRRSKEIEQNSQKQDNSVVWEGSPKLQCSSTEPTTEEDSKSVIGTSPTSRANSFSHCSSRWGENKSETISLKNSVADAALETIVGLNEVGDNTRMPSMKDGRMPKDVTFEAKEFGKNMQSKCDTLKSPKSKIRRRRSKEIEQDSHTQDSSVVWEGSLKLQGSSTQPAMEEDSKLVIGTSPTSRANGFSHCSSRWGENNSQTISLKNSVADAALDTSVGLNEVGDNTRMPSMKDGRMPKDVTFEAKEFGKNMQSKSDTLESPKSKIRRRRSKEIEQDSHKQDSSVIWEGSLKLQGSSTQPTTEEDSKSVIQDVVPMKSSKSKKKRRRSKEKHDSIARRESSDSNEEHLRGGQVENASSPIEPLMVKDKKSALQPETPTPKTEKGSSKLMNQDPMPEREKTTSKESGQRGKKRKRDGKVNVSSTEPTAGKDKITFLGSSPLKYEPKCSDPMGGRQELKEGEGIYDFLSIDPKMVENQHVAFQEVNPMKSSQSNIEPSSSEVMKNGLMLEHEGAGSKNVGSLRSKRHETVNDSSEVTIANDKKSSLQDASPVEPPLSVQKEGSLQIDEDSSTRVKLAQNGISRGKLNILKDVEVTPALAPKLQKKKRKKDCSPFRVKVGCVVAVRFRKLADGGNSEVVSVVKDGDSFRAIPPFLENNAAPKRPRVEDQNGDATNKSENVNDKNKMLVDASQDTAASKEKTYSKRLPKLYEVWSDPIPGRDDGMALLGSWIRCFFPKSFVANWQRSNKDRNSSPLGRTLEGNVISMLENNDGKRGVTVCLLVDRASIKSLPYLRVVPDESSAAMSSTKQKRRNLEAKIRGENKVAVIVTLASAFDQRNGSKLDLGVVSQWVVRKRVSAKPLGKKPSKSERRRNKQHAHSLFVGDSNDAHSRQEENWRWIASRIASQLTDEGSGVVAPGNNAQDFVSQLVGEVIKMDVSPKETQNGSSTLATVTIKCLWIPEQTSGGRLAHHRSLELFDRGHGDSDELCFQAPVEHLIVIGKGINRIFGVQKQLNNGCSAGNDAGWNFTITHSYRGGNNTYMPLRAEATAKMSLETCDYCLRQCNNDSMVQNEIGQLSCVWCQQLNKTPPPFIETASEKPTERSRGMVNSSMQDEIGPAFADLITLFQSKSPVDFTLPNDMGQLSLQPSFLPITGNMKSKSYTNTKNKKGRKIQRKKRASSDASVKSGKKPKAEPSETQEEENDDSFKPECRRIVSFEQCNKRCWGTSKLKLASDDTKQPFRENARPRVIKIGKTEEKTTLTGRAARANQRRMFRSLAALGDATTKVDRLAGRDREQQLRFDKSQIHGWGVFAQEQINAGDMIIEYRGEIIGNAVADKRELEYQRAKLDDYMFRIDSYIVCDATIMGNVARYINSSCSPNCYTQIITAGENKRIVIYAKRDIHQGEELCYDYKFSLEYDPAKRIPCHCGSKNCRGFMNWDKKYA